MPAASNLMQRHQSWYVVVAVPRRLWRPGVKRQVVRTLRTRDKAEAMRLRHAAVADILANIEHLSGAATASEAERAGMPPADLKSALAWRKTFAEIDAGRVEGLDEEARPADTDPRQWARFVAASVIDDMADRIEGKHGAATAATYAGIAHGTATPLMLHADAWLAEGGRKGPLNPRTAAMYRSDLKVLEAWLAGQGVTTLEGVTKPVAGRYISETMVAKGMAWATANRKITAPASYWQWLVKRGLAETSPWAGQQLAKPPKRRSAGEGEKRPFTEAETAALLSGDAGQELGDAIRIAALSGMRLEEIYRLTVADCAGGWFNIRQSKTDAGVRRVPIHKALTAIVARRTEGKVPGAFLFHEAGPAREGRERSAALSKRFGKYRQRAGVHDRAEGKRHSAVDFHSFRRSFVTLARNAGIDRAVVAAVVGHTAQDITDGVYLGAFSDDLLRQCVEAVRVPV